MRHRQPRSIRRRVITTAIVLVAVGAAVGIALSVSRTAAPDPVMSPSPTAVVAEPGHATEKRSALEPLPNAEMTPSSRLVDTTDELLVQFASDVTTIRNTTRGLLSEGATSAHDYEGLVTPRRDDCLLDWASRTLPTLAGTADVNTVEVCGRTAAFIVGGYSTTSRDLILRARLDPGETAASDVLLGATELGYASVATTDGKAVLIVAARPAA